MNAPDPIGGLVLLARGAADAGMEWRVRLRREWLPHVIATVPMAVLVSALSEWHGETLANDADIPAELEAAILAAMAEEGYD